MVEPVHERAIALMDSSGRRYDRALVYAEPNGSTWRGWIEFLPAEDENDDDVLVTGTETTQSKLTDLAYWATGLEPLYFEGAFRRALRRARVPATVYEDEPEYKVIDEPEAEPLPASDVVKITIESLDPELPMRLMATNTLTPGLRRRVRNGGVFVYEGTLRRATVGRPGLYQFVAQFGSNNAVAQFSNWLWNELHGMGATLIVDGVEVPMDNAAIKEAMLYSLVR